MKKIVLIFMVLFAMNAKAQTLQDSVEITLSIQARDIEYISGFIYNSESFENLVDSIRPAYRKLNNPTATTVVTVKGYTKDFIDVLKILRSDGTAIKNNCDARITALLSALNVPYISTKLTEFTDYDNLLFASGRSLGKWKLVKKR